MTAVTTAGLLAGLFGSAFVPAARAVAFESGADSLLNCTRVSDTTNCAQISGGTARISFPALVASTGAGAAGAAYLQTDADADGDEADEATVNNTTGAVLGMDATLVHYILVDGADPERITNGDADITIGADLDDDADEARMEVSFDLANNDVVAANGNYFEVQSDGAEVTITLGYYSATGIWTVLQTETVTFDTVLNEDQIDFANEDTLVGVGTLADCEAGFDSTDIDSTVSYDSGDDSDAFYICIQLYTVDEGLPPAGQKGNIDIEVNDTTGLLNVGNDGSSFSGTLDALDANTANTTDDLGAADNGILAVFVESEDSDVEPFNGTIRVTISHEDEDLGFDVSKTYTISVKGTGDVVSLTLVNTAYSLDDDADDDAIEFYGKDSAGNLVEVDLTADNEMIIDSDFSSAATMDEAGEEDAQAVVTITSDATFTRYISGTAGEIYGEIAVNCDDADANKESFTVQLVLDDAQTDSEEVVSNKVTIYCALDASDSMTWVSYSKSGGTATAKVSLEDANGYPVPDGTAVDAITSSGIFANAEVETENGVAEFTHLTTGSGTAVFVFTESTNTSLTKALSYGGTATLSKSSAGSVVANFGVDAAGETVTFTVEKVTTGKVLTITKTANANGRATYTLGAKRSGRWMVTATLGDEITNIRYVRR